MNPRKAYRHTTHRNVSFYSYPTEVQMLHCARTLSTHGDASDTCNQECPECVIQPLPSPPPSTLRLRRLRRLRKPPRQRVFGCNPMESRCTDEPSRENNGSRRAFLYLTRNQISGKDRIVKNIRNCQKAEVFETNLRNIAIPVLGICSWFA